MADKADRLIWVMPADAGWIVEHVDGTVEHFLARNEALLAAQALARGTGDTVVMSTNRADSFANPSSFSEGLTK